MTRTVLATVVALALVGGLLWYGPKRIALATERTGDAHLAGLLADHSPPTHAVTALTLRAGDVTFAGLGADKDTIFEIGSITKTFTAQLLQIAIEEGAVTESTTLGELINLADSPAATITMRELATHTSGLPRLAPATARSVWAALTGGNPYSHETRDFLIDAAASAVLDNRGEKAYSNFGFSLLGLALGQAYDTTYADLLQRKILTPLGMNDTYLMTPGSVPDDELPGLLPNGRGATPWESPAGGADGGLRTTASDMAAYVQYVLDEGIASDTWMRLDGSDTALWHDGASFGFSAMLIVDPATHSAVFVATDTGVDVRELATTIFQELHR